MGFVAVVEEAVGFFRAGGVEGRSCNARVEVVVTEHVGNENAAKLTRSQKEEMKTALAAKPSESGVPVEF